MILPIGDTPNPTNFRPWVNWGIILVNTLVYFFITVPLSFLQPDPHDPNLLEFLKYNAKDLPLNLVLYELLNNITAYDIFAFAHGYKPALPQISDLFTCMFLHANFFHLFGNMLYLWIFGDNVEHYMGRLRFLLLYLGTGIVATLTFSIFDLKSTTPLVGASGAISGVCGVYFLLFPRNRVKTFVFLFPFYMGTLFIPVRILLGIYVIIDNLLPFILFSKSNVAYGAHLGGFFAGVFVSWMLQRGWFSRKKALPTPDDKTASQGINLRDAIYQNDRDVLFYLLGISTREEIADLTPEECVLIARYLVEEGYHEVAIKILRQYINDNRFRKNLSKVFVMLGLIRLHQGQESLAFQHLLSALEQNPDPETRAEILQILESMNLDPRLLTHLHARLFQ